MYNDKNENIQLLCFVISDGLKSGLLIKTFQHVISKTKVKTSFFSRLFVDKFSNRISVTPSLGKCCSYLFSPHSFDSKRLLANSKQENGVTV